MAAAAPIKSSSGKWSATNPQVISAAKSTNNATSVLLPWLHNQYRMRHQNTGAVKWNATSAAKSQAFTKQCKYAYSGIQGIGESVSLAYHWHDQQLDLAAGFAGTVYGLYSEIKAYNFTKPGFQASAAHFTQMVWDDTTTFGCSASVCPSGYTNIDAIIYHCIYYPPGNSPYAAAFSANVYPLV